MKPSDETVVSLISLTVMLLMIALLAIGLEEIDQIFSLPPHVAVYGVGGVR